MTAGPPEEVMLANERRRIVVIVHVHPGVHVRRSPLVQEQVLVVLLLMVKVQRGRRLSVPTAVAGRIRTSAQGSHYSFGQSAVAAV